MRFRLQERCRPARYLFPINPSDSEFGDGALDGIDGRRGVDAGLGIDGLAEAAVWLLRFIQQAVDLLLLGLRALVRTGWNRSDGGGVACPLDVSFLHPAAA